MCLELVRTNPGTNLQHCRGWYFCLHSEAFSEKDLAESRAEPIVWTRGLSLQVKPSGPRDENKRRPGHQRQDKHTVQAHVLPMLRKMNEVNVLKDILRDALSRIDQIPSQSSQSQSGNPSQQQNLPVSTNNDSLLSRAQNNFR